ncbi:MAG TPA: GNAT family N-acetyltransferase [Nitrospiraceae bacterium]|nr:GNAT family N-acetyltransferase [Nitrospiraceae bacterium]
MSTAINQRRTDSGRALHRGRSPKQRTLITSKARPNREEIPPASELKDTIAIRQARSAEIPALRDMQERSLRLLGAAFYAPRQIAAFLTEVGTMDEAVVDEGHYFVAANADGAILASGGWSRQTPGYERAVIGSAGARNGAGGAIIRSVFVEPALARRGLATAIMTKVEQDADANRVGTLSMMATLSGLAFYARLGYQTNGEKMVVLAGGLRFPFMSMSKSLVHGALAAS